MEAKAIIFWGKGNTHKVCSKFYSYIFFSFFRAPNKNLDKLVWIQRRFLWDIGVEEKKITWVKWESVCLPKEKGGIGIRDLRKFNYALLGKWKWSFFHNKGELWARILGD